MGEWNAFEEDREFVLENLRKGFLDHLEVVSRVAETRFFQMLLGSGDLEALAETFPTPRKKEEVPLWLYLSAQITLRLHGAPGFSSLPYILHCGGLRDALEDGQVQRREDPETHHCHLEFKGYNDKNDFARVTPCDQDFVRKLARDTQPDRLEGWYGTEVAKYYRRLGLYDSEGIFTCDGSYLFLPDNEHYERSRIARFDKHNHPISKEDEARLPLADRQRCRWRRYYQVVSLCHTNRKREFLIYPGGHVFTEGSELEHLVPLVARFVGAVGKGVMKLLVVDRGFVDGESITRIKEDFGVDVLLPMKAKMDVSTEAWRLAEVDPAPWQVWQPPAPPPRADPPERPEHIRRRERNRQKTVAQKKKEAKVKPPARLLRVEFKVIPEIRLWDSCKVPIDAVVMREHLSDGEVSSWGLMTTRRVSDGLEMRELYDLRVCCEEGWRQTKCYWDLTGSRSTDFSLTVSQVVFVFFAYSLLQAFLRKTDRGEFTATTRQRLLAELLPDGDKIAVYYENRVAYLGVGEYTQIILNLAEGARRRLQGVVRRLTKTQAEPPGLPWRPSSALE